MAKSTDKAGKRRNRAVGVSEALEATLDPVLRKRGFANRALLDQWAVIAPKPYGDLTRPDRLFWPRSEAREGGAVLYLRVADGHQLAVAHEGAAIARAVNRYFGYVLVSAVKLSVEPFRPHSDAAGKSETPIPEEILKEVEMTVDEVSDAGVREALTRLGLAILKPKTD